MGILPAIFDSLHRSCKNLISDKEMMKKACWKVGSNSLAIPGIARRGKGELSIQKGWKEDDEPVLLSRIRLIDRFVGRDLVRPVIA